MFQHEDAIRVLEGEMDVVQCDDKRLVPLEEKVEHGRALDPIESGYGLVSNEHRPAVIDRPANRGALLLAAGQRAGTTKSLSWRPRASTSAAMPSRRDEPR